MQATAMRPADINEPPARGVEELKFSGPTLESDNSSLKHGLTPMSEMGRVSALSDAILLQFKQIDERLNRYLTTLVKAEKDQLQKEMKQFLDGINANHLIPLHFRIKVVRSFGREANFLTADLTSAILKTYQVGIIHLLEDSQQNRGSLLVLGQLCGEAIQLAMHVSKLHLEQYREQGFRITSQVHALARNGLAALEKSPDSAEKKANLKQLSYGLAWFEMMRVADFFSLRPLEQAIIYDYVETCMNRIDVFYVPRYTKIEHADGLTYLVSIVGEWNQSRPERVTRLATSHEKDRIVINISVLLPILKEQQKQVQGHRVNEDKQSSDLRVEDELISTVTATRRMLTCLHKINRRHERRYKRSDYTVIGNFSEALKMSAKASFIIKQEMDASDPQLSLWSSYDLSVAGMGSESSDMAPMPEVTSLVRLVWANKEHKESPVWATVVWRRYLAAGPGRTRMGLQFLPCTPARIKLELPGQNSSLALAARYKIKNQLLVWVERSQVELRKDFPIEIAGKRYIAQVLELLQYGSNYIACRVQVIKRIELIDAIQK